MPAKEGPRQESERTICAVSHDVLLCPQSVVCFRRPEAGRLAAMHCKEHMLRCKMKGTADTALAAASEERHQLDHDSAL